MGFEINPKPSGGTGVTLQGAVPGIADIGSFNVSGTGYAQFLRTAAAAGPGQYRSTTIGSVAAFGGRTTGDWINGNLCIGESQNYGSLDGNTIIGRNANWGQGLTYSLQNCVMMGAGVTYLGGVYGAIGITCIGTGASVYESGATVYGNGAIAGAGAIGCTVIGDGANATGATSYNIVIGKGETDSGLTNVISIGTGIASPTNNAIRIGRPSQTNVQLGPYVIRASSGLNGPVADANAPANSSYSSIQYTSLTAARVLTLPLANSVLAGWRLSITDFSGAASGVNTITTARSGADTLNGAAVDPSPIILPYGSRTWMSDGVSKWVLCEKV